MYDKLSDTEAAYLAGLLDGEGCIILARESVPNKTQGGIRYGYKLNITITNTSSQMIEWLHQTIGGKVFTYAHIPGWRTKYDWRIYGDEAREILRELRPYLTVKREQAEIALEYQPGNKGLPVTPQENDRRLDIITRLREVKHRA
jgi:hypothetical protein